MRLSGNKTDGHLWSKVAADPPEQGGPLPQSLCYANHQKGSYGQTKARAAYNTVVAASPRVVSQIKGTADYPPLAARRVDPPQLRARQKAAHDISGVLETRTSAKGNPQTVTQAEHDGAGPSRISHGCPSASADHISSEPERPGLHSLGCLPGPAWMRRRVPPRGGAHGRRTHSRARQLSGSAAQSSGSPRRARRWVRGDRLWIRIFCPGGRRGPSGKDRRCWTGYPR